MSNLIVEVFEDNQEVIVRNGTSKDGKPFTSRSQIAFAHLGGRFPVEISLNISEDQSFYVAGKYEVLPTSYQVGKYNKLEFGYDFNLKLIDSDLNNSTSNKKTISVA